MATTPTTMRTPATIPRPTEAALLVDWSPDSAACAFKLKKKKKGNDTVTGCLIPVGIIMTCSR